MTLQARYKLLCYQIGAAETGRLVAILWKVCGCSCAQWQECFHALATSYFLGKLLKLDDPSVKGLFDDEREEVDEILRVLALKGPEWYEGRMCECTSQCEHMDLVNAEAAKLK